MYTFDSVSTVIVDGPEIDITISAFVVMSLETPRVHSALAC